MSDLFENPDKDSAETVLESLSDAMDWLGEPGDPLPADHEYIQMPPTPAGSSWHAAGERGSGSSSGGGAGGSGGASQGERAGGRSRRAAAVAGGNALAAGLAFARSDGPALQDLGFDLAELNSMSGLRRINRILNETVGSDGGMEQAELRTVNTKVLKAILTDELNGQEAVRLYIVEYVMEVYESESLNAAHEQQRPAPEIAEAERQLRGALRARAEQLKFEELLVTSAEIRDAIYSALGLMRRLMKS